MLPFPPVLNLSQLQTGCRSQGEEKRRVLLESFQTSSLFSSPLRFLPTWSGEELSWLLVPILQLDTVPCSERFSHSLWFLPEESQGQGSLVGCRLWGCTELDTTEAT